MKNKWDHEVVNSQEDEDGFSLNPGSVSNNESAREKQNISPNRNSANTEPGSTKIARISSEAGGRISQLILSSSANLPSQ